MNQQQKILDYMHKNGSISNSWDCEKAVGCKKIFTRISELTKAGYKFDKKRDEETGLMTYRLVSEPEKELIERETSDAKQAYPRVGTTGEAGLNMFTGFQSGDKGEFNFAGIKQEERPSYLATHPTDSGRKMKTLFG